MVNGVRDWQARSVRRRRPARTVQRLRSAPTSGSTRILIDANRCACNRAASKSVSTSPDRPKASGPTIRNSLRSIEPAPSAKASDANNPRFNYLPTLTAFGSLRAAQAWLSRQPWAPQAREIITPAALIKPLSRGRKESEGSIPQS